MPTHGILRKDAGRQVLEGVRQDSWSLLEAGHLQVAQDIAVMCQLAPWGTLIDVKHPFQRPAKPLGQTSSEKTFPLSKRGLC